MKFTSTQFSLPPEGVFVHTKISDSKGDRSEQQMKRKGNLWFSKDGMYAYYAPTHWAYVEKETYFCDTDSSRYRY